MLLDIAVKTKDFITHLLERQQEVGEKTIEIHIHC